MKPSLLIEEFVNNYSSPGTKLIYRRNVQDWIQYCNNNNIRPSQANRKDVQRWMSDMSVSGLAPNTIGSRLAAVKSFYNYCLYEGYVSYSPCAMVKAPVGGSVRVKVWLTRTEMSDWLVAAKAEGGYTYAAACLLALNGLRANEACSIDITDVKRSGWHYTATIHGKGGGRTVVPLPPQTMEAVSQAIGDREFGPVLLSGSGVRMDRYCLARTVRRLGRAAGINKKLHPHSLRHSAITAALNSGVPLRDVQIFARHANPSTTIGYDRDRQSLDRHASYSIMQYVSGAV